MMASPELLILDEPCAGLDLYERERFLDALSELSAQKLSMLYVTHHIEEIVPVFTHVALMAQGQIVASGHKRDVLLSEKLEEAYNLPLNIKWREGRPWIQVGKGEQ
jgi:iron complex transport system ATP-binding protein